MQKYAAAVGASNGALNRRQPVASIHDVAPSNGMDAGDRDNRENDPDTGTEGANSGATGVVALEARPDARARRAAQSTSSAPHGWLALTKAK
jgi:hypothetical protein